MLRQVYSVEDSGVQVAPALEGRLLFIPRMIHDTIDHVGESLYEGFRLMTDETTGIVGVSHGMCHVILYDSSNMHPPHAFYPW
jgi:hypothetical protein